MCIYLCTVHPTHTFEGKKRHSLKFLCHSVTFLYHTIHYGMWEKKKRQEGCCGRLLWAWARTAVKERSAAVSLRNASACWYMNSERRGDALRLSSTDARLGMRHQSLWRQLGKSQQQLSWNRWMGINACTGGSSHVGHNMVFFHSNQVTNTSLLQLHPLSHFSGRQAPRAMLSAVPACKVACKLTTISWAMHES